MKMILIHIDMPYYFSETSEVREQKQQADIAARDLVFTHCTNPPVEMDKDQYLVTDDDFFALAAHIPIGEHYGEVRIKSFRTIIDINLDTKLGKLYDQIELLSRRIQDSESLFNNKTQSPIAGNHLLSINDTLLKENCCTDELQNLLDEGWRIIAVCPQEARRPDYILGRHIIGQ